MPPQILCSSSGRIHSDLSLRSTEAAAWNDFRRSHIRGCSALMTRFDVTDGSFKQALLARAALSVETFREFTAYRVRGTCRAWRCDRRNIT